MSPVSRSKSKEKKAGKETQKVLSKSSGPANAGSGIPASVHNPLSGTFHVLETMLSSSASSLHTNGCFHNIDETDDHLGASLGAGVECDSISNNGSWSGESEEHKDKTLTSTARQEMVPGADTDKREKVRQKNEKKHQRQKERRAQELHERCCGYIMSRKLEARIQQLVSMGFSNEHATAALMLNEGKIEESISWLIEGGQDVEMHRGQDVSGGNLKIDISEELTWIADMEIRYNCTKQEVERAVVSSEGDLEKAAESLRLVKLDPPAAPLKPEEIGESPAATNCKLPVSISQNVGRPLSRPNPPSMIQVRREDKESNYTKVAAPSFGPSESGDKSVQPLKRIQSKMDWANSRQTALPADKRWPNGVPNPSVSYSLASTLQVSSLPAKTEPRLEAAASEYKSVQPTVREPVVMMQRPQSVNTKQVPATSISSSSPGTAAGWYPTTSVEVMKSNGFMSQIPSRITPSPNNLSSSQMFHQLQQCQQQQHFVPGSSPRDNTGTSRGNGLWSRVSASPTLSVATSLGLFSGLGTAGSSGASSPVDWSTAGSMTQLDYTNIDWSLDRGFSSPRTNGLWVGSGSLKNGAQMYDSNLADLGAKLAMRSIPSGNGVSVLGLHDGVVPTGETSASGSREWTSPFEGNDLFSLPRQFVSFPSL